MGPARILAEIDELRLVARAVRAAHDHVAHEQGVAVGGAGRVAVDEADFAVSAVGDVII